LFSIRWFCARHWSVFLSRSRGCSCTYRYVRFWTVLAIWFNFSIIFQQIYQKVSFFYSNLFFEFSNAIRCLCAIDFCRINFRIFDPYQQSSSHINMYQRINTKHLYTYVTRIYNITTIYVDLITKYDIFIHIYIHI
jgi:hypothetical protein